MKTTTKTLLVSALAMACAGGVYAQGAGGAGGGVRGGAAPSGNTLEQPGIQPGMNGGSTSTYDQNHSLRSRQNQSGYGSPGATGTGSGRSTVSPGMDQRSKSGTGRYTPQQNDQPYKGHQE
ncbi:MAG: hypothetical protein KGQ57_00275 [Burkholderiales bacterium]|nr:hypothetical protein [Burkholderiales bacterium]